MDRSRLVANRPGLALTLGSQVQHESHSGGGVQPTARVMWKARPHQRVWAAASRALRTPSLYELGIRVDRPAVPGPGGLPLVAIGLGNPAIQSESLVDAEAGYRLEIGTAASIDVTGFAGSYDHLQTHELSAPTVQFVPSPQIVIVSQFGNLLKATTRGLEVSGQWTPIAGWRLDASYTGFGITPHLAAASQDPIGASEARSTPRTQLQMRAAVSPGARVTLAASIFRVGEIKQLHVDGYSRADVSAEWRFTNRLSAMAIGQNLLDGSHAEFGGTSSFLLTTRVPRSGSLRLRWTF